VTDLEGVYCITVTVGRRNLKDGRLCSNMVVYFKKCLGCLIFAINLQFRQNSRFS
jgi:hypothetical protein